jgi:iron(III) transport system substrate-binding protein
MRMAVAAALTLIFSAHAAQAQSSADWDKIVAAAKAEGAVTLYTGLPGNPSNDKISAAFEAKYAIRANVLGLRASELRERIRTEYVAGRTLGDVSNTSPNQTRQFAEEDGTVEAFGPLPSLGRIRPDIAALWAARDVHVPIFGLYYAVLANTRLAPDPPQTYADLTDSKWKGKILADDFRPTGGGHSFFSTTYGRSGAAIMRSFTPTASRSPAISASPSAGSHAANLHSTCRSCSPTIPRCKACR